MSWWRDAVIYQVYPRSFQDASGDGVGDLAGIAARLDYLVWLGVDAIWLNPFYPSPMADFGYDITDHTAVAPLFGDLEDFDRLLDAAHRRGQRVLIDFVPNHTSAEHPWFLEARRSRTSPERDWYFWRDPRPDGGPPNNWVSPFGGSQWELDERTGQYYLHAFGTEQPDLNWRNPAVEQEMLGVLRFWLERGVDGFRIDVANFVMKDPELRDNPANPTAGTSSYKYLGHYDTQLHLHDKGHPDAHAVYRRLRRMLDGYGAVDRERIAMGEIHLFEWPDWTRHWAAYYGEQLDELHLPLNFTLVGLPWQAERFARAIGEVENALPDGAWPNLALGSHDEPRVASRVGPEAARVALMLLLTLRGTPILYYGDELGMQNVEIPTERAQDPFGRHDGSLGRDPERTPMQWDATPNAGFCPPSATPWLPLAADAGERNVARQRDDPDSELSLTRRVLAARRALPALRRGRYERVDAPDGCLAYLRDDVLVALNFTGDPLPFAFDGRVRVSTKREREGRSGRQLGLDAHEGLVIELSSRPTATPRATSSGRALR